MRWHGSILVLAFALAAGMQLLSPVDLLQGDQEKQVGYVMDLLHGGRLSTQFEVNGRLATKPPLYNWCAAAVCLATGSTAFWAMKLPALLAGAGTVLLTYLLARRHLGAESAFWAALAMLAAHHVQKLMWFARTDMLLAFTVLLAIHLSVALRPGCWRGLVVGLVLGASFLTKGPVGPALYSLWLVLWAWRQGAWRDRRRWLELSLGAGALVLIAGAWLAAVWRVPGFQETVLHGELGSRLARGGSRSKPFWYYVPLLLGRIAPWPLVAAGAVVGAWRRRDGRWQEVRFVLVWSALFFVFFSAIPAKRHDLLLPVYPPVFILAGLGLQYAVAARRPFWPNVLVWGVALAAVAGSVVAAVVQGGGWRVVVSASGIAGGATGAVWLLRGDRRLALAVALLALLATVALESWSGSPETRAYARLQEFLAPVQGAARSGQVVVWQAHPLVSYELGLHQRGFDLSGGLTAGSVAPLWLLAGKPVPESALSSSANTLVPAGHLRLEGQGVEVTLYRVVAKESTDSL